MLNILRKYHMHKALIQNRLRNYSQLMRLSKPIGFELLLWPTLWALWLASGHRPTIHLLFIFIFGAFIMRAAGCIMNDFADRKLDGQVQRTAKRPLANNLIPHKHAIYLFIVLSLIAFGLACLLGPLSIIIACCAMVLVILYPYCKRWIPCPQFVLGLVFNSGILIAFAATQQHLPASAWGLLACAWLWTVAYDTAYAMADRPDDLKIGIKSTAIWFGRYNRPIIAALQISMLTGLYITGRYYQLTYTYNISLALAGILFIYQHRLLASASRNNYTRAFLNNHWVGLIIFLGIIKSM